MRTTIRFEEPGSRKQIAAFSLTDLMVVIAVTLVLAGLACAARAGATDGSKRAVCVSHLRQFALALQVYGSDYKNRLPANTSGSWAWDCPWNLGDQLNTYGAPWQILYCPGTAPRFSEADNWQLYRFVIGSFHVLGYACTLSGTTSLVSTNWNATLEPRSISYGLKVSRPSDRVLLADGTISGSGQYNEAMRDRYNYTSIPGGFRLAQISPHLQGLIPAGGNLAMLDGHVEWRPFAEMHIRSTSGVPGFWW